LAFRNIVELVALPCPFIGTRDLELFRALHLDLRLDQA
jgi:hypothetical protein